MRRLTSWMKVRGPLTFLALVLVATLAPGVASGAEVAATPA
jgi:hypothetical protein